MTLDNLYYFVTGVTLTGAGVYLYNMVASYKKAANSQKVAKKEESTPKACASLPAPWNGKHYPRLEDMF
jgi:hypothetical protein